MTPKTTFRKLNMQFASSGIRMTPEAKFRESILHFTSSGTGMTQRDKFEDRWCILLFTFPGLLKAGIHHKLLAFILISLFTNRQLVREGNTICVVFLLSPDHVLKGFSLTGP